MDCDLPLISSENLLLKHLLSGICKGITSDENISSSIFIEGDAEKDTKDNVLTWKIQANIVYKPTESAEEVNVVVPIVIPRLGNNYLYNLYGSSYYIVTRQRLVANIPICTVRRENSGDMTVECKLRSTNMITGESREVKISRMRIPGKTNVPCIQYRSKRRVIEGDKKGRISYIAYSNKVPALQYLFADTRKKEPLLSLARLMGFTDTVINILRIESSNMTGGVRIEDKYILPSCVDTEGRHIVISYDDVKITTEEITILLMLCKMISVELGILEEDDQDSYANKIAELPATLMALTIRRSLRKQLMSHNIANIAGAITDRIYNEIFNGLKNNIWSVVEDYNAGLQLSRNAYGIPKHGLSHALKEVVTYRSSVSSSMSSAGIYDVRHIHPTQRGFVCMLMTPDDDNAGLRQYLAKDAYISYSMPSIEEIVKYRELLEECMQSYDYSQSIDEIVLWMHNYYAVGIAPKEIVELLLNAIKREDSNISWNSYLNIIESRSHYGRFMVRVDGVSYDSREVDMRCRELRDKLVPFSEIALSIPFMRYRPPARALLGARIMSKSIGTPTVNDTFLTHYRLMDISDEDYPTLSDGGKLFTVDKSITSVTDRIKNYIFGRQQPLVTTTLTKLDKDYFCGTHVICAEMTYMGYGVEDGLIVNRRSVERGMFVVFERLCIRWDYRDIDGTPLGFKILVKKNQQVMEGDILFVIQYKDDRSKELKNSFIRHTSPYRMVVDEVRLVFGNTDEKILDHSSLISVEVILHRKRRLSTGDKLANLHGQKMVIVKILDEKEMPILDVEDPKLRSVLKSRNYRPDIIMNTLSIVSRSTVSQIISSTLSMYCVVEGYDRIVEEPFGRCVIQNKGTEMEIDPTSIKRYKCKAILSNGLETDNEICIGCEYLILPPHLADTKRKGLGNTVIDRITGIPRKIKKETPVRLGWQEMYAIMHSNSISLAKDVYESPQRMDKYPYCNNCKSSTEIYNGKCAICREEITDTIDLPKQVRGVQLALYVMGCRMKFSKDY